MYHYVYLRNGAIDQIHSEYVDIFGWFYQTQVDEKYAPHHTRWQYCLHGFFFTHKTQTHQRKDGSMRCINADGCGKLLMGHMSTTCLSLQTVDGTYVYYMSVLTVFHCVGLGLSLFLHFVWPLFYC